MILSKAESETLRSVAILDKVFFREFGAINLINAGL
jgi:hypothetical protein